MKNLISKKSSLIVVAFTIVIATIISCSNNDEPIMPSADQSTPALIEKSKHFASLHNECIRKTLSELNTSFIHSNHITPASIHSNILLIMDSYISEKHTYLRNISTNTCYIDTISSITSTDISFIRESMSDTEIIYIDQGMTLLEAGEPLELLMIDVEQSELPEQNKEAILNFLSTLEASSEYWEQEGDEWIEFLENNLPEEELQKFSFFDKKGKIQWKQIAFADAYYGWFGTVSTGGNLIVGAGAAAAGSIFSALNFL